MFIRHFDLYFFDPFERFSIFEHRFLSPSSILMVCLSSFVITNVGLNVDFVEKRDPLSGRSDVMAALFFSPLRSLACWFNTPYKKKRGL